MSKEKVLIIEDDEVARNALKRAIDKSGFETIVAEDGKTGLEIFEKENPEIVITDLRMPEIDGMEVLHTVKKSSPDTEVIVITAYGDYDTAIQALREGAIDYIKKPIDLEQLMIALGRSREKIAERKKMAIKPTILLLEDEDITREKLARVLSKEGWDVLTAGDGEEGMKIFYENKIDVILADIKMPKKDGIEVLHEVKKKTQDCEVIVITGYGDESTAIQAMREGAINYLRKPIDLDQMIISVEKALEKLNMRRSILYKIRELELAKEIIAKITRDREIVVDVRDHTRRPARDFAQRLLDAIPVGLMVLGPDLKVIYTNEHLKKVIEFEPEVVDENLINKLSKVGIKEIDFEGLTKTINRLFEAKPGEIETISVGKYAYIAMTKLTVLGEEIKQDAVLVIMRGERPAPAETGGGRTI